MPKGISRVWNLAAEKQQIKIIKLLPMSQTTLRITILLEPQWTHLISHILLVMKLTVWEWIQDPYSIKTSFLNKGCVKYGQLGLDGRVVAFPRTKVTTSTLTSRGSSCPASSSSLASNTGTTRSKWNHPHKLDYKTVRPIGALSPHVWGWLDIAKSRPRPLFFSSLYRW